VVVVVGQHSEELPLLPEEPEEPVEPDEPDDPLEEDELQATGQKH